MKIENKNNESIIIFSESDEPLNYKNIMEMILKKDNKFFKKYTTHIIFDFSEITKIHHDVSGLLIMLHKYQKTNQGKFYIKNLNENSACAKALKETELNKILIFI